MQVEETTPSTPLPPTRAGFVRGLPLSMPVEEVIERGREAGIKLQPSDIHAARYYMRKAEESPQQLLLGGQFVHKRGPRGANGAAGAISAAVSHGANGASNGAASKAVASSAQSVELVAAAQSEDDSDDEFSEEAQTEIAPALKGRGRKAAAHEAKQAKQTSFNTKHSKREAKANAKSNIKGNTKLKSKAELKAEHKANGANGLHSRLQARLRNVTFRDTAREERDAARAEKATIGKALSELDTPAKSRGKRAAQTAEAVEQQLRQIALRVGTQRVRELLDAMEELAARRA